MNIAILAILGSNVVQLALLIGLALTQAKGQSAFTILSPGLDLGGPVNLGDVRTATAMAAWALSNLAWTVSAGLLTGFSQTLALLAHVIQANTTRSTAILWGFGLATLHSCALVLFGLGSREVRGCDVASCVSVVVFGGLQVVALAASGYLTTRQTPLEAAQA